MNANTRTNHIIGASLIFLRLNTFLYVKLKLYIRCLKVRLQTTTKTCTSWNWSKQSKHHPTQTILAHKALRDQINRSHQPINEESRQLHPEFLMWWLGNLNRTVPLIGRTHASITTQRQTDTSSSQVIRCGISPNTYGSSKELDSDSYQMAYLCRCRFCPGSLGSSEGRARGEAVAPRISRNLAVYPWLAAKILLAGAGISIRDIFFLSLVYSCSFRRVVSLPLIPSAGESGGRWTRRRRGGDLRQREEQVALAWTEGARTVVLHRRTTALLSAISNNNI